MRRLFFWIGIVLLVGIPELAVAAGRAEHVVVVVFDGMRPDFISQEHTPTLHRLAREGVMFQNHHAVYCSATEVNGTALATGCYPETSGIIANRDYLPKVEPMNSVDVQSLRVIRKGDEVTGGRYLLRPTLEEILQSAGRRTTVAGSKPVAVLHDRRERSKEAGDSVIVFEGKSLPASAAGELEKLLGKFPQPVSTRSLAPNTPRDEWTRRALLGTFWADNIPPFSLLWLSEPDFSQHAAGPGSPKALAALKSSDDQLAQVLAELDRRGVRDKTDVFIVSDHGFSTVNESVNVTRRLRDAGFSARSQFTSPPAQGDILVVGGGGSVLFYVIGHSPETSRKLVRFLQEQEFAGVVLTREPMEGTFTLAEAKINSPAPPDVVLSLRWSAEKSNTGAPGLTGCEGGRRPGEGSHASLSRFDLHNTLVASGPDLKKSFNDTLPSGNTDLAPTILWLLGVKPPQSMDGRVLSEALTIEAPPVSTPETRRLEASYAGEKFVWQQYLKVSQVNQTVYLDEGNGSQIPADAQTTR